MFYIVITLSSFTFLQMIFVSFFDLFKCDNVTDYVRRIESTSEKENSYICTSII